MRRPYVHVVLLALLLALAGCAAPPDARVTTANRAGKTLETSAPLVPSATSRPVPVPRVKGKTATAAKWRLESAGFKVKTKWARNPIKRGRVIAQKPSGGSARPGSTVLLTVSAGTRQAPPAMESDPAASASSASDKAAARAFQDQTSGIRLTGAGVVTKVLSDDNDGSRHQRFILRLSSGQTLLVAHNIDIAPRVQSLQSGDTVAFSGVYEWSSQGGTVHWTHHDPSGQHAAGWLKHDGLTVR